MINQLKPIINQGQLALIAGDLNIDLLLSNDAAKRSRIKSLIDAYEMMRNDCNICQLNFKPTRYRRGQRPSLLDHFMTNAPNRVDGVETIHNHIADHTFVKLNFHREVLQSKPQFREVRDYKNLNSDNLMKEIEENEELQSVFSKECPNDIFKTLITELNKIIDKLAPSKLIQIKKKDQPYMSPELKELETELDEQLNTAIRSKDIEEWRLYKSLRNQFFKYVEGAKRIYYSGILNTSKELWKTAKKLMKQDSASVPDKIMINGKLEASPKRIADSFCEYFLTKIRDIKKNIPKTNTNPMTILKLLVPEVKKELKFREITIRECYDIISNTRGTNTCGFDSISAKTMKLIPHACSLFLTHGINAIIRKKTFPSILKLSRILPISKKLKNKLIHSSYRPISNLHTFEKVVEEWLKQQIMEHIESENVILEGHHGGLKDHSTLTAKAVLDFLMAKCHDQDKLGVVISTDLSSAFDIVSHPILLEKIKHYGIKGEANELLESYLSERTQYVKIQGKESKVMKMDNCSVIQGSRMSGVLYTLYTNEVTVLHKLLEDEEFMEEQLKRPKMDNKNVEHDCTNFVDDSNSVVQFSNPEEANNYIKNYFDLLKLFYNTNELQINDDKTNLLAINKPNKKKQAEELELKTEKKLVKPQEQIKLLGWIVNKRMDLESNANEMIKQVSNMLHIGNGVAKYMSEKTRIKYAKSYMMSRVTYGLPLYCGSNENTKKKIHNIILKICRWTRRSYCFKESCSSICRSVNVELPDENILKSTAIFSHNTLSKRKPKQIVKLIRMPRTRAQAKLSIKYKHSSSKFERTLIYQAVQVYNENVPNDLKSLEAKEFKKKIRKMKTIKKG